MAEPPGIDHLDARLDVNEHILFQNPELVRPHLHTEAMSSWSSNLLP